MQPTLALVLAAALAALNTGAFIVAVHDKRAARVGARRVRESWFYGLSLLGGWLGLFLAFASARHKTRKFGFLAVVIACAAVNLASLVALVLNVEGAM